MVYHVDFPSPETAVEWSLTEDGVDRSERTYRPQFYVTTTGNDVSFEQIRAGLRDHPDVTTIAQESHRPGWRHEACPMLAIEVITLDVVDRLAASVSKLGMSIRQILYAFSVGISRSPSISRKAIVIDRGGRRMTLWS